MRAERVCETASSKYKNMSSKYKNMSSKYKNMSSKATRTCSFLARHEVSFDTHAHLSDACSRCEYMQLPCSVTHGVHARTDRAHRQNLSFSSLKLQFHGSVGSLQLPAVRRDASEEMFVKYSKSRKPSL
jgi:hypothetical protein